MIAQPFAMLGSLTTTKTTCLKDKKKLLARRYRVVIYDDSTGVETTFDITGKDRIAAARRFLDRYLCDTRPSSKSIHDRHYYALTAEQLANFGQHMSEFETSRRGES